MAKSTTNSTANVSIVKLGDAASLLRLPPGVRDEKTKKGGKKIKVISIVDLPEAGYIGNIKDTITLSKEKFSSIKKYVIQPFDVLMSIQGTVGKVGVVAESMRGDVIANISLLAIRFKENKADNAVALLQYLKSTAGRKLITKLQKGSTIKRINVKEFAAAKVPMLTADIKRQSKSVFDKEVKVLEKITDMYDSLETIRKSYLSSK
jgi:type I restriction enzyme M protein